MRKEQFAINSISTSGSDLVERLDAYSSAGFRHVEFFLGHVKSFLESGHTPEDVRRLLEERGLRCIGGFETHLAVFAASSERTRNHTIVEDNARLVQLLGGENLIVGTDGPQERIPNPLDEIVSVYREAADRAGSFGVNLLIEFNWSPIIKSLRTAVEVAEKSGAPNAGVLFDSAHYHCTPTKLDQIRPDTVKWIKAVHVNDMRDKPGELSHCNDDRELPGQGHLNLRELFGRIEECGYEGYFCIEMFSKDLWELEASEASRRMYESMLGLL